MNTANARGRLVSLDAFRGLTIAGMILVNNPGSWAHIYAPLRHADWHGWTPTDLIFPFFLFIVGVALPFSFRRRIAEGAATADLMRHVARRSILLIAIGIAMRAIPDFDFGTMRYYGVLQRIGLVYFVAAGAYLMLGLRGRATMTGLLLLGYWAMMMLVPVPGYGAGDLTPDGNLAAWIDRLVMGGHLWQETWDPEGLLSTLPAIATALLGTFTGEWLSASDDDAGRPPGSAPPGSAPVGARKAPAGSRKAGGMAGAGVLLVVAGLAWDVVFPINKNLWTSSYVVFTAGAALLVLAALYWMIDVRGWRGAWERWMVVYGMNAITVFVASGMLSKTMARVRLGGPDGATLYATIYEVGFRSWAGDVNGSLAFAVTYVLFWLGLMWILYARRIYIKI